jgi:hypothetical protein
MPGIFALQSMTSAGVEGDDDDAGEVVLAYGEERAECHSGLGI